MIYVLPSQSVDCGGQQQASSLANLDRLGHKVAALGASNCRQTIDRMLLIAKSIVQAKAAAVTFEKANVAHVIAHSGIGSGNVSFPWPIGQAAPGPSEVVCLRDSKNIAAVRLARSLFGSTTEGSLVRIPVVVSDVFCAAILLHIHDSQQTYDKTNARLLKQTAKEMAPAVKEIVSTHFGACSANRILAPRDEVLQAVRDGQPFRIVFDCSLKVVAVSHTAAARMGSTADALVGKSFYDLRVPAKETVSLLYKHVLESHLTAPDYEISSDLTGQRRTYTVRASPIKPLDSDDEILDVVVTETTDVHQGLAGVEDGFSEKRDQAVEGFLLETLPLKRALRSRGDTNFMSLRTWNKSIKEYQIRALRSLKAAKPFDLARAAGAECASEVDRLVGAKAYRCVVPVPCGHSPVGGPCLANEMAIAMGAALDLPVINAFAHLGQKGSSHPKQNLKRAKMQLVQQVPPSAILIDDVASSGVHIDEAATILRQAGVNVFSLAWISGE
jgi:hypothetical protein